MTDKKQLAILDRQIDALGIDAVKKISSSTCIISGMNGLGVEIAKNILLSGVKVVAVHDTEKATMADLSSQFYLTKEDIGKNRAEACVAQLAELNEYAQVEAITGELTEAIIAKYKVVVLVNKSESEINRVNEICRKHDIKFIVADMAGLFSRVFVDVGENHNVIDQTGERVKTYAIGYIGKGKQTLIDLVDGELHTLSSDDYVSFSLVEGMTELNDRKEPFKVIPKNRTSFYIDIDSTSFKDYTKNGYVNQVKIPAKIVQRPYKEEVKKPTLVENGDYLHFTRKETLHCCFLAMDEYRNKNNGKLPTPHDPKEAEAFADIAFNIHKQLYPNQEETPFDKDIAVLFGRICSGNVAPVSSTVGGIVGQEVMKAVSFRLLPLHQWLYLDHSQILDLKNLPSSEDAKPMNSRYDGQIAVFGKKFQDRLLNAKCFLVGSGAIGCEALKNYALMGIGCGEKGLITVTDMDNIELSNLSRQFLFRQKDIQKSKSETAAVAIKKINPDVHIRPLTLRVGLETENVFNRDFWQSLDFVTNALDNVPSRLYVDNKCVNNCKPLFEGGTLGTKCNTQSVIPHLTENYGASSDPPEADIPMCTVRNLPYMIEHTIEYARGLFVELFTEQLADVSSYLNNSNKYIERLMLNPANRMININNLYKNLVSERPHDFDDCIRWGRKLFEETFSNQIKQLLFNFPPGQMTQEGTLFWSGKRRQPHPITFDKNNQLHLDFVGSAAYIRAVGFGISVSSDLDYKHVGEVADAYKLPEYVPRKDMKIEFNESGESKTAGKEKEEEGASSSSSSSKEEVEEEMEKEREEEDKEFHKFSDRIPSSGSSDYKDLKVTSIDFEKDGDTNHHIDFITACANIRALNYEIPTADRQRVKMISGKIIPALATTTGVVSGLSMLDLYTYLRGAKDIESYRNWFVNLAINIFTYSEPMPATKDENSNYTVWDQIILDFTTSEQPTLRQFVDYMKKEKNVDINMISYTTVLVYMDPPFDPKQNNRMDMKLTEVIEDITKKKMDDGLKELIFVVSASNPDDPDNDLDLPPVTILFPPLHH